MCKCEDLSGACNGGQGVVSLRLKLCQYERWLRIVCATDERMRGSRARGRNAGAVHIESRKRSIRAR